MPALAAQSSLNKSQQRSAADLPWPNYGASAIGAVGYGVLASHGSDKPIPTASVAKTMTALTVLQKNPLSPGETGPTITLTKADVGYYDKYFDVGGSIVPVSNGEKITEYQALEAMMLPSANNMASSLADWAFGSEQNYTAYANKQAEKLGMSDTHFADASGFSPKTVSTASDLVKLGIQALQNPALAKIVSEKTAKIPVAGVIHNVNWLLNYDQFNGIKTGSTDQDGGAILYSEPKTYPNGQTVTIVGVIMGAKLLSKAMNDVFPLIHAAQNNFKQTTVIHNGQVVGHYDVPWDVPVDAVATKSLDLMAWRGRNITPHISFKQLQAPSEKGVVVGKITTDAMPGQSVSVITKRATVEPGVLWRAFRNL